YKSCMMFSKNVYLPIKSTQPTFFSDRTGTGFYRCFLHAQLQPRYLITHPNFYGEWSFENLVG
ncbi:MAG: hypothetical protein SAK29_38115, partial [Scytonema sp. PMC 1069.18]|nr:hypothetical protein [Scytonema sp. PMC 1069.18]